MAAMRVLYIHLMYVVHALRVVSCMNAVFGVSGMV